MNDGPAETDHKERVEEAYDSWRRAETGILEAARRFGVDPDEIMDEFYRKEPFRAWWVETRVKTVFLEVWLRSLFPGSRR